MALTLDFADKHVLVFGGTTAVVPGDALPPPVAEIYLLTTQAFVHATSNARSLTPRTGHTATTASTHDCV